MKNTICIIRENRALLSQHIGDLDDPKVRGGFLKTLKGLQEIAGLSPKIIAHDLHPDYFTTRVAGEMKGVNCCRVQHHHAHMVSCMADNQLKGPVVGLIFDGTGYGTDQTIWGGELLMGDALSFQRLGHLSPFPLPGGETAIHFPWRTALGVLYYTYGEGLFREESYIIERVFPKKEIPLKDLFSFKDIMIKGINCPLTSSVGRLFDAVAALLGFYKRVNYEGQPAIHLEFLASLDTDNKKYPIAIEHPSPPWKINIGPIVEGIIQDIIQGLPKERISRRFHNTIIKIWIEHAWLACEYFKIDKVVLSGGCFQNRLLLDGIIKGLRSKGIQPCWHKQVPTNDGGICLGQAVCAGALFRDTL